MTNLDDLLTTAGIADFYIYINEISGKKIAELFSMSEFVKANFSEYEECVTAWMSLLKALEPILVAHKEIIEHSKQRETSYTIENLIIRLQKYVEWLEEVALECGRIFLCANAFLCRYFKISNDMIPCSYFSSNRMRKLELIENNILGESDIEISRLDREYGSYQKKNIELAIEYYVDMKKALQCLTNWPSIWIPPSLSMKNARFDR